MLDLSGIQSGAEILGNIKKRYQFKQNVPDVTRFRNVIKTFNSPANGQRFDLTKSSAMCKECSPDSINKVCKS